MLPLKVTMRRRNQTKLKKEILGQIQSRMQHFGDKDREWYPTVEEDGTQKKVETEKKTTGTNGSKVSDSRKRDGTVPNNGRERRYST